MGRRVDWLKGSFKRFAAPSRSQTIGPEDVFETLFSLAVERTGLESHSRRLVAMVLEGDAGNTQREKRMKAG